MSRTVLCPTCYQSTTIIINGVIQCADVWHAEHFAPSPALTATDLRRLAQYILSAAKQLQDRTIGQEAYGLLKEWHKAAEPLRQYVNEFPGSCADTATKRAMGMLVAPQLAKDAATQECEALLLMSDEINNWLLDDDRAHAAEAITRDVIHAYHVALEKGQS